MEEFHRELIPASTDLLMTFYFFNYKHDQFLICLKGFLTLKVQQCINGLLLL